VESMGLVCGFGSSLHVPMFLYRFNRKVINAGDAEDRHDILGTCSLGTIGRASRSSCRFGGLRKQIRKSRVRSLTGREP
jgi:hypothetical protein